MYDLQKICFDDLLNFSSWVRFCRSLSLLFSSSSWNLIILLFTIILNVYIKKTKAIFFSKFLDRIQTINKKKQYA